MREKQVERGDGLRRKRRRRTARKIHPVHRAAYSCHFLFSLCLPVWSVYSYGFTIDGQAPAFVSQVEAGGPAERAGLCRGDRILEANGVDLKRADPFAVAAAVQVGSGWTGGGTNRQPQAGPGGGGVKVGKGKRKGKALNISLNLSFSLNLSLTFSLLLSLLPSFRWTTCVWWSPRRLQRVC